MRLFSNLGSKLGAALGSEHAKGRLERQAVYDGFRRSWDYHVGVIDPALPTFKDMCDFYWDANVPGFDADRDWLDPLQPSEQEAMLQRLTDMKMKAMYPLPFAAPPPSDLPFA